ncbi:MAG: transcription termination/antitermination protein NusG [Rickettsiales bacterium]|nr:MAG: transcription termination/antitermination protein NusG [Rickettsiales bacterium]
MSNWYILNVIAGQEKSVATEVMGLAESYPEIKETFIPEKTITKTIRGKKHEVLQKLYPCYVFVNMDMTDNARIAIKNLGKALNFLGTEGKPKITPESEIESIRKHLEAGNNDEDECLYSVGDLVKINKGSFDGFTGVVEIVDSEKKMLKLSVSIFGRENEIEIEIDNVEKV